MEFRFIDHTDPFLERVIQLGKRNSQTLGLMPRDAYVQQAKKKCIAIAFNEGELLGFCLFRVVETKQRIGITQVCIDSTHRGKGIAKLLLDQVRDKYKGFLKGMLVSCREDYTDACHLWSHYGFVRKKRVRSRSIEEKYLIKFWYSFDQKDLFSAEENDLRVVLDLNILIKLRDQDKEIEEIAQLLSDWLTDEVEYCYAKETLNEIHRDKDFQRTNDTIQFLSTFQELTCNPTDSQKYLTQLKELHPGETDNHISDRKQLAECKASNISYFITIDEELIAHRNDVYDKLSINILRPGEFILEIDELKNRRLYEPIRLQGAHYETKRIDSSELLIAIDTFLNKELGEKKSDFQKLVLTVTSDTQNSSAKVITAPDKTLIAFYGTKFTAEALIVPFLRIKKNSISNTLFSQLIVEVIRDAVRRQKSIICIQEKDLSNERKQILSNLGFVFSGENWQKIALNGMCELTELSSRFKVIESNPEFVDSINFVISHQDPNLRDKLKMDIERKLWPLKLTDLSCPVFIVPIKPLWASQLFDHISSSASIFGAPPELSWSRENVYYRSFQPNVESFPGRILWYASQEKGFARQKAIVACSYLNNVETGEAKQLYSRFRRFGIYKWDEIMGLAKGDIHKIIKVLQFSDTEVFPRPVSFTTVNEILVELNFKQQTFVSPVRVDRAVFNKIYTLATGIA